MRRVTISYIILHNEVRYPCALKTRMRLFSRILYFLTYSVFLSTCSFKWPETSLKQCYFVSEERLVLFIHPAFALWVRKKKLWKFRISSKYQTEEKSRWSLKKFHSEEMNCELNKNDFLKTFGLTTT